MKKLVLALSLLSMSTTNSYVDGRYNLDLFLNHCAVENQEQYERLSKVVKLINKLDEVEKRMIFHWLCQIVEPEDCGCDACCDEIIDQTIQEVLSGCESCC